MPLFWKKAAPILGQLSSWNLHTHHGQDKFRLFCRNECLYTRTSDFSHREHKSELGVNFQGAGWTFSRPGSCTASFRSSRTISTGAWRTCWICRTWSGNGSAGKSAGSTGKPTTVRKRMCLTPRPCLINGGMPHGKRFFRQSRQIFAGGLPPGKKT